MHELAAIRGALTTVLEQTCEAGAVRVISVELTLGASGHVTEAAAQQHFEALAVGTPAEGAVLTFVWRPATYQCLSCLRRFESGAPAIEAVCPDCGEIGLEIAHRDDVYVSSIEVEMPSDAEPASGEPLPTVSAR
jgi:Zn finger protein HypA/HybF involved in hydrogenase expression